MKLSNIKQTIIISHTIRRFLINFKPIERTKNIEALAKKLGVFLRQKEKSNREDFIFATEYERVLWMNATDKYDKETPVLALDFVTQLYSYFEVILSKYANVSPKLIEKIGILAIQTDISSKEAHKLETNSGSLINTYIGIFEEHSGVSVRKSLLVGKFEHLKK